ncbi:MAG: ectonucleotide pyrophosphatase/phosphodiesterase [Rhodanobacter sp.]
MKFLFRVLLCSWAAFSVGCATQQTSQQPTRPVPAASSANQPAPFLLISIDGYRSDYIARGLSTTLQMLANTGVHADSMQPSFPSLTFPNHYTLVTGLRPDHHGIVNNTMFDRDLGHFSLSNREASSDGRWWAEGTPIWETADRHGLKTATLFWPGSQAAIHGYRPDHWKAFDATVTPDQRVDQVLAWLDLPAGQRPTFLTLYFDAVDHAGHLYGPNSTEVDDKLRETDEALSRLVRGLRLRGLLERINLIVLADHGMAGVPEKNSVVLDDVMPLDHVQVVTKGILAGFNPRSNSANDLAAFADIEKKLEQPQDHMRCWDKTRVPARLAYGKNPRVPQLLCLANIHWRIVTREYAKTHVGHLSLGDHGFDNADPLMRALFVAHGPAFRFGIRVPEFSNVDVYPLIMHVLGLPASPNDGSYDAVKEMLKPPIR